MEIYTGVEEQILEKATSEEYGYSEGQVFDIYTAALKRVTGNRYKNIPLQEKSWMIDRWTWKILFPMELHAFPGIKPGWADEVDYFGSRRRQDNIKFKVEAPKSVRAEKRRKLISEHIDSQPVDRPEPANKPQRADMRAQFTDQPQPAEKPQSVDRPEPANKPQPAVRKRLPDRPQPVDRPQLTSEPQTRKNNTGTNTSPDSAIHIPKPELQTQQKNKTATNTLPGSINHILNPEPQAQQQHPKNTTTTTNKYISPYSLPQIPITNPSPQPHAQTQPSNTIGTTYMLGFSTLYDDSPKSKSKSKSTSKSTSKLPAKPKKETTSTIHSTTHPNTHAVKTEHTGPGALGLVSTTVAAMDPILPLSLQRKRKVDGGVDVTATATATVNWMGDLRRKYDDDDDNDYGCEKLIVKLEEWV
ncbi:hypothetical protein NHQ30_002659 [Ciborinia camelliae]|nr:hypothetical protein NHQ30_002659 [Ciborinia camelliae]